jgi:hypothetical protein
MIMSPERMTHSILFATGEMHAILMFVQVAARSRPDLLAEFEIASQHGLANLEQLPTDAGDTVIEGYQFVTGALRKSLQQGQREAG